MGALAPPRRSSRLRDLMLLVFLAERRSRWRTWRTAPGGRPLRPRGGRARGVQDQHLPPVPAWSALQLRAMGPGGLQELKGETFDSAGNKIEGESSGGEGPGGRRPEGLHTQAGGRGRLREASGVQQLDGGLEPPRRSSRLATAHLVFGFWMEGGGPGASWQEELEDGARRACTQKQEAVGGRRESCWSPAAAGRRPRASPPKLATARIVFLARSSPGGHGGRRGERERRSGRGDGWGAHGGVGARPLSTNRESLDAAATPRRGDRRPGL